MFAPRGKAWKNKHMKAGLMRRTHDSAAPQRRTSLHFLENWASAASAVSMPEFASTSDAVATQPAVRRWPSPADSWIARAGFRIPGASVPGSLVNMAFENVSERSIAHVHDEPCDPKGQLAFERGAHKKGSGCLKIGWQNCLHLCVTSPLVFFCGSCGAWTQRLD